MQWLIGILGGLTGGGLALFGGWLADLRARRHAHSARVRGLGSAVLTAAYMVQDCVLEVQVKRGGLAGQPDVVVPSLDTARLTLYEAELVRTATELAWLVNGSLLADRLAAVRRATTDLVQHWGVRSGEWNTFDDRLKTANQALDDELRDFVGLRPHGRRRYLRQHGATAGPASGAVHS